MIYLKTSKALSLFVSLLLMSACSSDQSTHKKPKATKHLVEITQAQIQQVSVQKKLPGTLEAIRTVQIFNQEPGLLNGLPFHEGDPVDKGAVLATLDDALINADRDKAIAAMKQAKLDLKRLKDLAPRKLASEDEIAKARTTLDIAQAEVNRQKTRLKHTRIQAPFSGMISKRLVEPGDVIPLHSQLLSLIDTSSLIARIYISELLLPLIRPKDQVIIQIDALGDQQFKGQVVRMHPTIEAETRRGIIEVELKPVPKGALPGQLCRVTLNTLSKSRLMIPFDAVRHDPDGAYVYRVIDNKAQKVSIQTGLQNGQDIEVLDGLADNDQIIIKGFFGLKNNKAVTVKS